MILRHAAQMSPIECLLVDAEFRLRLRPENADLRLTEKGDKSGCISNERMLKYRDAKTEYETTMHWLKNENKPFKDWVKLLNLPGVSKFNSTSTAVKSAWDLLSVHSYCAEVNDIKKAYNDNRGKISTEFSDSKVAEKLKVASIYERFIKEQEAEFVEVQKDENMELPINIDYTNPRLSLSVEEQEKLTLTRPTTIGSMSRIPGISPRAIITMLRFVKNHAIAA